MNNLSARILHAGASVLLLLALSVEAAHQKDVMLVLDNSGSMRKNDPQFLARGAVASFINKLDSDSRAGVLIFDHGVRQAVPLTAIDADSKAILIKSLDNINYRGQLTDSPAAVERAIYELKTGAREGADKFIIFMTDGIVDTGNPEVDVEKTKWLREELAVDAADNGIKVFAIAFTEHADFFLIQSLAKKTAGEYFRALTPADLVNVFDTVHDKLNAPPPAPTVPPPMAPPPKAPSVAVPDAPPAGEATIVVTPIPDEPVKVEPLAEPGSPAELLASLTPDERQALEEIAEQTGIPLEQLALELVGSEPGATDGPVVADDPIITYPDDELTPAEERVGFMLLAASAALLLLLAWLVVWFVMRRRKATSAAAGPAVSEPEREPAIPEAFIKDIHGYTDDSTIQLGEKPLMVGRVAGADTQHLDYLVVNKGTVGRRHAIIKYKDYAFWLVDQGSVNGTFVNGERLSGERQLKHGDKIRFHKYDFEFTQPDMDDGFHTVFADPNAAQATIVASAETLAATSAMDLQASVDAPDAVVSVDEVPSDGDDLFGMDEGAVDESPSAAFADASAFSDADVFDVTGETANPDFTGEAAASALDAGDETIDEGSTAVFDALLADTNVSEQAQGDNALLADTNVSEQALGDDEFEDTYDEDDEDLGVEINLDAVGAEDHPSLILHNAPPQSGEDFDADASAFFEDITVGPTPDDEAGPVPDAGGDDTFEIGAEYDEQATLDAKLERASAILDGTAPPGESAGAEDFGEMETMARSDLPKSEDPNDLTVEESIDTDSFDAPATVPPVIPNLAQSDEAGDVTLEAFISTSMFEGGKVELTNEDATALPQDVPDEPNAGDGTLDPGATQKLPQRTRMHDDEDVTLDPGATVKLPRRPGTHDDEGDDEDDGESEDTTLLK